MSLILVGLNHKTSGIEVRERFSVAERETRDVLGVIRGLSVVRGAALISTCNRVETLVSSESEEVIEPLVSYLTTRAGVSREEIEHHLYILRDGEVVRHLFRVASGLDSMIVGEPQIAGQVRSAFVEAQRAGMLDANLQRLFEQTLRVAKKVRSETGIGEHAVSVPYAAVELARKIFGDLAGLQILLIGAGKIGELTAEHLHGYGVKKVFVANRARERAQELAARFMGEAIEFADLGSHLETCDIVISSTAAPHFVIAADDVAAAMIGRRRRDLFLIDLSVPRNIDPGVARLPGAYLYDIDDLREVVDSNREKRLQKADKAEAIVEREVDGFLRHLAGHDVVPTIVELRDRLEEIRKSELERCLRKLGPITTNQQAAIDALTSSIINKILHYPILRLKESANEQRPDEVETFRKTVRKIFGLR